MTQTERIDQTVRISLMLGYRLDLYFTVDGLDQATLDDEPLATSLITVTYSHELRG